MLAGRRGAPASAAQTLVSPACGAAAACCDPHTCASSPNASMACRAGVPSANASAAVSVWSTAAAVAAAGRAVDTWRAATACDAGTASASAGCCEVLPLCFLPAAWLVWLRRSLTAGWRGGALHWCSSHACSTLTWRLAGTQGAGLLPPAAGQEGRSSKGAGWECVHAKQARAALCWSREDRGVL